MSTPTVAGKRPKRWCVVWKHREFLGFMTGLDEKQARRAGASAPDNAGSTAAGGAASWTGSPRAGRAAKSCSRNLKAMCQRCHLRCDAPLRAERRKREQDQASGQTRFWPLATDGRPEWAR